MSEKEEPEQWVKLTMEEKEKDQPEWKKWGFESEEEYILKQLRNTPDIADYVKSSCGQLGSKTCVNIIEGSSLGEFDTEEEAEDAIREFAHENKIFTNVWTLSDHGNWHLNEDFKFTKEEK